MYGWSAPNEAAKVTSHVGATDQTWCFSGRVLSHARVLWVAWICCLWLVSVVLLCAFNWSLGVVVIKRHETAKITFQSGTCCQMNLEFLTASIVLNGFWKQSSLAATSVTSALGVIFNEMRYINLRFTYLLFTITKFLLHYYSRWQPAIATGCHR